MLSNDNLVFFIETPFRSYKDSWLKNIKVEEVEKNIIKVALPDKFYLSQKIEAVAYPIRKLYQKEVGNQIAKILINRVIGKVILVNFNFLMNEIMSMDCFDYKIYFCNDDFPNMSKSDYLKDAYKRVERKTVEKADLCFGVSYPLVNKLKNINKNTRLFLPAHDVNTENDVYTDIRNGGKSINVAFMGYINKNINYDWIEYILKCDKIKLYLIGPIQDRKIDSIIKKNKNVHYLGIMNSRDIHLKMKNMDILIIPYIINSNVLGVTAPNKLFQYLATGRPIVISDIPNLLELPEGTLYMAKDRMTFLKKIEQAYEEDCEEYFEKRIEVAKKNTWDIRKIEFEGIIEKMIKKR